MINEELAFEYACNLVANYRKQEAEFYEGLKTHVPDWQKVSEAEWPSAFRLGWRSLMASRCRAGDWIEILIHGHTDNAYGVALQIRDYAEDPEMALLEILTS